MIEKSLNHQEASQERGIQSPISSKGQHIGNKKIVTINQLTKASMKDHTIIELTKENL